MQGHKNNKPSRHVPLAAGRAAPQSNLVIERPQSTLTPPVPLPTSKPSNLPSVQLPQSSSRVGMALLGQQQQPVPHPNINSKPASHTMRASHTRSHSRFGIQHNLGSMQHVTDPNRNNRIPSVKFGKPLCYYLHHYIMQQNICCFQ